MQKIIFLDVDGVLNSLEYFDQLKNSDQSKKIGEYQELDVEKVRLLAEIITNTGAEIVLSSTWRDIGRKEGQRDHPMYQYLVDTLDAFGLKIIDHTPYFEYDRPREIKEWLNRQEDKDIRFVSLDDDFTPEAYEKYGIGEYLVRTTFYGSNGGLQKVHVKKAIDTLND